MTSLLLQLAGYFGMVVCATLMFGIPGFALCLSLLAFMVGNELENRGL